MGETNEAHKMRLAVAKSLHKFDHTDKRDWKELETDERFERLETAGLFVFDLMQSGLQVTWKDE